MEAERYHDVAIVPDETKFPGGYQDLNWMAEYAHNNTMKFGVYAGAGSTTCAGVEGSLGYEDEDALQIRVHQVDYLKYGNCYNEGVPAKERYGTMSKELLKPGPRKAHKQPIYYSIVNWGNENIADWGYTVANSWRTTPDLMVGKGSLPSNTWQNLKGNFLKNQVHADKARVGGWNDLDSLLVGNGILTLEEEKTHFALWAFAKSPLIASADLTKISAESLAILTNAHLIKVNQDKLGKQAVSPSGNVADSVYQVQGIDPEEGPFLATIVVNWDDEAAATIEYDPVAAGAAFGEYDSCVFTDLWTGEEKAGNGAVQQFNLEPHQHTAFKSKCLPW